MSSNGSYYLLDLHARYPMYIIYIIFGAPTVLTNLIILGALCCDKKLLAKSAMIAGLAGGNVFNGLHALGFGIYRLPLVIDQTIDFPAKLWSCAIILMPSFLLFGYSITASMQFVIGLERLIAIAAFNWYRIYWSSKKSWSIVAVVYLSCFCAWVIPTWCQVLANSDLALKLVTKECASGDTIDSKTVNALMRFSPACGISGIICLLTAVGVGRRRFSSKVVPAHAAETTAASAASSGDMILFKKQMHFLKMMLIVVLLDFIFIVTPGILNLAKIFFTDSLSAWLNYCAIIIYCGNSLANVVIFLVMNNRLRKVIVDKLKLRWLCACWYTTTIEV